MNKKYDAIDPKKFPTMPSLYSLYKNGDLYIWHNFIITFQKNPVSLFEYMYINNEKECPSIPPIKYLYSMQVFYNDGKPPYISGPPILALSLEQADYSKYHLGDLPLKDEKGSIMIGLFRSEGHQNFGEYTGNLDWDDVSKLFLSMIREILNLDSEPVKTSMDNFLDVMSYKQEKRYKTSNDRRHNEITYKNHQQKVNPILKCSNIVYILYTIYLLIGGIQLFAIYSYFEHQMGWSWIISGVFALIAAYTPLLGTLLGIYAAVEIWAWSWVQAFLLFLLPFLLIVILSIIYKNK